MATDIFKLTEEISDIIDNENVDKEKLINDILDTLEMIPQEVMEKINDEMDKVINILSFYHKNDFDIISEEDKNEINDIMLRIVEKISANKTTNICDEDINNLFYHNDDDMIEIPEIDVLQIKGGQYKYDQLNKKCGIIFENVKMKGFKMYAYSNNRYIINNVFSVDKLQLENIFMSNFFNDQFNYINNLDESSKILLYTYTTTMGILIVQEYKLFHNNTNFKFNIFKSFDIDSLTNQIPLFYILIDYLENKHISLDYNNLNNNLLQIIKDEVQFTQDDMKNVIKMFIDAIYNIINSAPKLQGIVLYRGIKRNEYFTLDSNNQDANNVFNSFSFIPYISWGFVNELNTHDFFTQNFCCMIKAEVKEEIPALFISIISSERYQYEIILSQDLKYVNQRNVIESCTFKNNMTYNKISNCSQHNRNCDKVVNDIKRYFGDTIKSNICENKCNINVTKVDVIA